MMVAFGTLLLGNSPLSIYLSFSERSLVELEKTSAMKEKEYRCTRNAPYSHDCLGHNDPTEGQGYYLKANSAEEAWPKMAIRFPDETSAGFTVQEWESFNVKVVKVERDEEGNIITLYIFGGISLAVLMGAKQLGSIKGAQKRLGQ